jgi:membrane protein implicated in regulation of membrane protease activity
MDLASYVPFGSVPFWILLALVAGIVELASPLFGFVFVSLAALVTAGLAAVGLPVGAQIVVFSVTLVGSLAVLRPRLVAGLGARGVPARTEALLGHVGRITVAVDPVLGSGRVVVGGEDWAARAEAPLAEGTEVRVVGADGIVLCVEVVSVP